MTQFKPIRRKILQLIGATSLASCASRAETATPRADGLPRTPTQPEGPFYPTSWDGDTDGNLAQIDQRAPYRSGSKQVEANDKGELAPGAPLVLRGTILRSDGKPASDARVDIWQTDHTGRYRHPRDAGAQPLKSGFQGYGRVKADAKGRYEFTTIRPADYQSRPPHIHVRVDDGASTLITQMYFAGDNQENSTFASVFGSDEDRQFDIYL